MEQHWHDEELAKRWSLSFDELAELSLRSYPGRLGFAVLLKFLQIEGRFPEDLDRIPSRALDYLAGQVGVSPSILAEYDFSFAPAEVTATLLYESR